MKKIFLFVLAAALFTNPYISAIRAEEVDSPPQDMNAAWEDVSKSVRVQMEQADKNFEKNKPFADKAMDLLKQKKYREIYKVLDSWKKVDPDEVRIPLTRLFLKKILSEKDPQKRSELETAFETQFWEKNSDHPEEMAEIDGMTRVFMEAFGAKSRDFNPELFAVVSSGDEQAVKELLDSGASVDSTGELGNTVLIKATHENHARIAKLLIDRGADVNKLGLLGITALIDSSAQGNIEITQLLLNAKADVAAKTNDGTTALAIARQNGHNQIVELLKKAGAAE